MDGENNIPIKSTKIENAKSIFNFGFRKKRGDDMPQFIELYLMDVNKHQVMRFKRYDFI
jgi:hypothetical protein